MRSKTVLTIGNGNLILSVFNNKLYITHSLNQYAVGQRVPRPKEPLNQVVIKFTDLKGLKTFKDALTDLEQLMKNNKGLEEDDE